MPLSRHLGIASLLVAYLIAPSCAQAESRSSTNYTITADTLNNGVGDMSSTGYRLVASLGDAVATETQGSLGYLLRGGYRSQLNLFVPSVLNLISVFSRKVHTAAGTHDLPINIAEAIGGLVTVEPRVIGAGHTIHFRFDQAITNGGTVAVTDAGGAPLGTATAAASGNDVIVTLTGIPDNRRARIALNNPNGSAFTASIAMGFLVGDVNNSRSVTAADISGIKSRSTAVVTSTNYKLDLNLSGVISAADVSAVKARAGTKLP